MGRVRTVRAREAAVPEDPLFGTRLFVCAKNWVLRHSTAGLDIQYEPTKNQFFNEPEGLRHFRDHRWKALGEENSDLLCLFL